VDILFFKYCNLKNRHLLLKLKNFKNIYHIKMVRDLIRICKKLRAFGFVEATSGNISMRKGSKVYITTAGSDFGEISKKDIALVDLNGKQIKGKPSSETRMHLEIYKVRDDCNAIIHTHPLFVILNSFKKYPLPILPEANFEWCYVKYLKPGSLELAKEVSKKAKRCDAIILERHGLVCLGRNLKEAFYKTEIMEKISKLGFLLSLSSF